MTSAEQGTVAEEPTIRPMRSDEVEEVFALIQAAFGPAWPGIPIAVPPLDHLKWRQTSLIETPEDILVMELHGRIVGYWGAGYRYVWVRGHRLAGFIGGDKAIHPDFQHRGLIGVWFRWLEETYATRERPVVLAEHSTHPRLLRSMKRRDLRVPVANRVDRLTLYLQMGTVVPWGGDGRLGVRSVLRSVRVLVRIAVNRLRWRPYSTPAPALTLRTIDEFDDQADTLWARARDAFDFGVVRDQQYLNWRYCDPRAGIYRVRAAEREGELVGFVVTALNHGDAQIVDVLAVPGDEGALRALIEDAVASVRAEKARALTMLMPRHHAYRETFLRYGFIVSSRASSLGFGRRKDGSLDFLGDDPTAALHVAFGDGDTI